MTNPPRFVTAAFVLILVNASVWLAFGVTVALGMHPSFPGGDRYSIVMASLALLAAVVLVALAISVRRGSRWGYTFTVSALVVLVILTIADQVGLVDLAVLAIEAIALSLLIKERAWFWRRRTEPSSGG